MNRFLRLPAALGAFLCFATPVGGQEAGTAGWCGNLPIAGSLSGAWVGEGELFGRAAAFRMEWSCSLGGHFLRLSFENRFAGSEVPVLRAEAFYGPLAGDSLSGTWFDSRGARLALHATVTDSSITTTWVGAGERGQTTYRVGGEGAISVVDSIESKDGWREFAMARYRRK